MKKLVVLLAFLCGCQCEQPMQPTTDAGASPPDASQEADAPFVCEPEETCPSGWNWTPCGCATDNPDLVRGDK